MRSMSFRHVLAAVVVIATSAGMGSAQTSLSAGQLLIIGRTNNGSPDSFTFAPLVNIDAGTTIYFTDNGWTGSQFRGASATDGDGNENLIRFVANNSIAAGRVILSTASNADFTWTTSGSIPGTSSGSFANLSLSTSGDQITAFQGPNSNPLLNPTTMLYTLDDTNGFENATDAQTGNVATGLTAGSTAVTFNNISAGTMGLINDGASRNPSQWLSYASDFTNWSVTTQPTADLNVVPEPVTFLGMAAAFGLAIRRFRRK
jgi:hypothetical protein